MEALNLPPLRIDTDEYESQCVTIVKVASENGVDPDDAADVDPEDPGPNGKSRTGLDWDSYFADAERDFDLDESPLEFAVKNLTSNKEIQQLSVIRTLPGTIIAHGIDAINTLLPILQSILAEGATLDIHCEASELYRTLIKDKRYESISPGINEKLFAKIVDNIEVAKDNVSAVAWLESVLEVIECLSLSAITDMVVPLIHGQAAPTKRIQRRVVSARLIEKLCPIVSVEIIRKDLAPCAMMLCHDPSTNVRSAIAQRLAVIAQSLNSSSDCVSLLLPCLIELCKDDDPCVREAILNTVAVCLPCFTKESRKTVILPLLRKCSEQALILRDPSMSVVAKQLGPWLYSLRDITSPVEKRWFLDTYCRIANFSPPADDKIQQSLALECRKMCAFNLPCFAMMYSGDVFEERVVPLIEKFCTDTDEEVRSIVASGFHEVIRVNPEEGSLLTIFVNLVHSSAVEVIQALAKNFDVTMPILYAAVKREQAKPTPKLTRVQLDRLIAGCNRLIRNTGNWRAHEAYLTNLVNLRSLISPTDIQTTFIPLLKQEVLTAKPLPCKTAAAVSLLLLMRGLPLAKNRQAVVDFFTKTVAKHESCLHRRTLLDVVPAILTNFSRSFFKTNFLEAVLSLAEDTVSNIRLQMCRLLPSVKRAFILPDDEPALLRLEKAVRGLLTSETSTSYDRQLYQQYACELSRAETLESAAGKTAHAAREKEEKKLWSEVETVEVSPPAINGVSSPLANGVKHAKPPEIINGLLKPPLSNGESPNKPQTWKTTRASSTKVAVVKPQPQVIITQRSASPMPPKSEEAKPTTTTTTVTSSTLSSSRLPLSTRYRSSSSAPTSTSTSPSSASSPHSKTSSAKLSGTSRFRLRETPSSPSSSSSPTSTNFRSSSLLPRKASGLAYSPSSSSIMSKSYSSSSSSPTGGYGLSTSRSMSAIRRPYGLMKVQSSSAIERKPGSVSIRVTGMS